jgi:outer membrane lipoprotein-sorting protein
VFAGHTTRGRMMPTESFTFRIPSFGGLLLRAAIAALAAFWLGACASKIPVKTMEVQSLIEDAEKKAYLVKQFRADFVRTRQTSVFKRDVTVKGRLIFQKPNRFGLTMTGDANVEVLSDGSTIKIIHDGKDREVYQIAGERDMSRFADPLMLLIHSIGNGGLRRLSVARRIEQGDELLLELEPGTENHFERIKNLVVAFSADGQIKHVKLLFKDGTWDDVVFDSWAMLAQDDPEILRLDRRLKMVTGEGAEGLESSAKESLSLVRRR